MDVRQDVAQDAFDLLILILGHKAGVSGIVEHWEAKWKGW